MGGCSRCTGYRPIIDAFKAFAKVEPGAYTEEAIQARQAAGATPSVPQDTDPSGVPQKQVLHKGQVRESLGGSWGTLVRGFLGLRCCRRCQPQVAV